MKADTMDSNEIKSELKQIKSSLRVLRFLLQKEDGQAAALLIEHLIQKIHNLVDSFDRLGLSLKIDTTSFGSLKTNSFSNQDLNSLRLVAKKLNQSVWSIEKEYFMATYLNIGWLKSLWKNQTTRKLLISLPVIVLLIGLAGVARQYYFLNFHALEGEYYSDTKLKGLFTKKRDIKIDFNWKFASPLWNFRTDFFSVRWSGFLRIPEDGLYTFTTLSDDGVRLYVDEELLIDDWKSHLVEINTKEVVLRKGKVPIKLEYFEHDHMASIQLMWKRPSGLKTEVIPPRYFSARKK